MVALLNKACCGCGCTNTTIYIGGNFSSAGGQSRSRFAVLCTDGTATNFSADADNIILAIIKNGTSLYAGGLFTTIGGVARRGGVVVDSTTGAVSPIDFAFNQSNPGSPSVFGILINATTVYMLGDFRDAGGTARSGGCAFDLNGNLQSWNPDAGGAAIECIALYGGLAYIGGNFGTLGGIANTRISIGAVDPITGALSSWYPGDVNGGVVSCMVAYNGVIYFGGGFGFVNGVVRNGFAAVDAASGALLGLDLSLPVHTGANSITVSGGIIYITGTFTSCLGSTRNRAAAFDSSGVLQSWDPNCDSTASALSICTDCGKTVIGGFFTHIGGLAIADLAMVNSGGVVDSTFNASVNGSVRAVLIS